MMGRLDPLVATAVTALAMPTMDDTVVAASRLVDWPAPESTACVERSELVVPGDPPLTVRVHRPRGHHGGALPAVVAIHGGGYVVGNAAMDDFAFERMCPALGVVGVSVEYRLAPDTPYSGPLVDCYRALRWTFEHAADLGIDSGCIGVRGVSAGGGLAAAVALLAHQRGEVTLGFQLLECPMLDDRQRTRSSRLDGLPVWTRESNEYGWRSYLGELYGTDDVPSTAAPARAADSELVGLPPAFVGVGAVDGFLDEDVEYVLRLSHAGVPTELHVYPGGCHGFQMAPDSPVTKQANRDVDEWLARQIASSASR